MKLICTITGAQVEANKEAAQKLIASGCFAEVKDALKTQRKQTRKE